MFFCFSATTNNNEKAVWPCKTIPCWPCCWPIVIMCYLVVHHHWINPQKILLEIHCHSIFECVSICFSSGITIQHDAHTFSRVLHFVLDLIWQPGFLINVDGYRYHFTLRIMRPDQVVLTLFTFEIFSKQCD